MMMKGTAMSMMQKAADGFGYVYAFEDGTEIWSREFMTDEQLLENKAEMDYQAANYVEYDEDDYEPYYTLGEPRISSYW